MNTMECDAEPERAASPLESERRREENTAGECAAPTRVRAADGTGRGASGRGVRARRRRHRLPSGTFWNACTPIG
jgi:hypothetical protein